MKLKKYVSFIALSLVVLVSSTVTPLLYANTALASCMLASGCDGEYYIPYSKLNKNIENDEELPPYAFLRVRNNSGNTDQFSGTTKTVFTFDGNGSYDYETPTFQLEVRFDFEDDGVFDTYFSTNKTATHTYDTPGEKTVRMEVLDKQGNVTAAYTTIKIVKNQPPEAFFTVSPYSGTPGTVFTFDTKSSTDSQYSKNLLQYRFDWESNGKFDTKYSNKTIWQHKFDAPGKKTITMEVRDPEGSTSRYQQTVTINPNTPPTAKFTVTKQISTEKQQGYRLDATKSFDPDGETLLYRWDHNNTGENDIVWDTTWTSSPVSFANFYKTGEYIIKLMVKDKDGATATSLVRIFVDLLANKA